jgi:site-specific recombinase XerD
MTETFEQTLERYLQRWRPTLRPSTLLNKRGTLRNLTAYLREHHPDVHSFAQLQRQPHIEGWLEHILYLKSSSRNKNIRNLRLFFEDLIQWLWPQAPVPGLLSDEDMAPEELPLPKPLPLELDQAVQQALSDADSFAAMALLLLRFTGMRVGEMIALPLNALEASDGNTFSLRVPLGKTRTERMIPLSPRAATLAQRILQQRGCRQKKGIPARFAHYMMVDHFGRHLWQQSYDRNLKAITARIDTAEPIHCHRLRHSFATEMARAGMPVPALMKLLGHQTPKMTMRYVEVAHVDVRQAYDQALVQLRLNHTVQARALPPTSPTSQQPDPDQLLKLMQAIICGLESLRRDAQTLKRTQQLRRFIKRMRKAGYDLKDFL